jgi:hypothetical protein
MKVRNLSALDRKSPCEDIRDEIARRFISNGNECSFVVSAWNGSGGRLLRVAFAGRLEGRLVNAGAMAGNSEVAI